MISRSRTIRAASVLFASVNSMLESDQVHVRLLVRALKAIAILLCSSNAPGRCLVSEPHFRLDRTRQVNVLLRSHTTQALYSPNLTHCFTAAYSDNHVGLMILSGFSFCGAIKLIHLFIVEEGPPWFQEDAVQSPHASCPSGPLP
jgi:hypothetical protein